MKTRFECIPCIMKQAYNTAIRVTNEPEKIKSILDATADYVKGLEMNQSPADASNFAYRIVSAVTGVEDPYKEEKRKLNDFCLSILPELRKKIEKTDDLFYYTMRASLFGNIIDLGIGQTFDIEKESSKIFEEKLAKDEFNFFSDLIAGGRKKILYLGDNAGEIVFDMLFIEKLINNHYVVFVVKSGPVINDATMDDALHIGLTSMVKVIETGSNGIGVKWSDVTDEFIDNYRKSDIIISKGQGNFETMNEKEGTIFFLLKAKCECVAEELGVKFGESVFVRGGR